MLLTAFSPPRARRFEVSMKNYRWVVLYVSPILFGCGARTELRGGNPQCVADSDCDQSTPCFPQVCDEGRCFVAPLQCPSDSVCEPQACNPASGACEKYSITQDLDGDGFHGPRPGYEAGQQDSCGDDCDDTSALAFPGGSEVCDGVDNDCDKIVDNDARFLTFSEVPELRALDQRVEGSSRRGLAYGDGIFAAGYWSKAGGKRSSWITGIDENRLDRLWSEETVLVNAESFGADLVWSGDAFGGSWQDLRFSDYEIFFNRFDAAGRKLGPDLRITNAPNFSTQSIVRFDQGRYIVSWTDSRGQGYGMDPQVYVQLIDAQGQLVGPNQAVSTAEEYAEGSDLAATPARYGIVYTDTDIDGGGEIRLVFASFDKNFGDRKAIRLADSDVVEPRIVAAGDKFVVTWSEMIGGYPGSSIMGAIVDEEAEIVVPPSAIATGAATVRESALLSFGDRFMLFWVDDYDGNLELYAQVQDLDFNVIEERVRLTDDPSDTRSPIATRGASGTIAFLVDDWRSGSQQGYYSAIECRQPILR